MAHKITPMTIYAIQQAANATAGELAPLCEGDNLAFLEGVAIGSDLLAMYGGSDGKRAAAEILALMEEIGYDETLALLNQTRGLQFV